MAVKSVLGRAARRFGRDRRGNYGMMMAVLAPMLLLGAGFGINIAQLSTARSNLLAALDSAVTSTARDITTGVIKEEDARTNLEAFLFANGERSFSKLDKLKLDSVVLDRHRKTVEAKASVTVSVAFPLFGAANVQTITTESAARYSDRQIEVAMVLDVTGSMKNSKITNLKTAAKSAVEVLLSGNKHSADRVRIAIVPYAEAVNVGAKLVTSAVFYETKTGPWLPPPGWSPPASRKDNCATERRATDGSPDFSDDAPSALRTNDEGQQYRARINRDWRIGSCPSASLIPLSSNKSQIDKAIDGFKANGWTGGGIAAQWGYYMLSPKWRDTISGAGLGSGPADYDPEKIGKIAILMTDGEFNTAFAGVPLEEKPQSEQTALASANAKSLCEAMKKDGIEIFTIGFALPKNEEDTAWDVLRNCASPDTHLTKHFYSAATGDDLKKAFLEIARNIEQLALTK